MISDVLFEAADDVLFYLSSPTYDGWYGRKNSDGTESALRQQIEAVVVAMKAIQDHLDSSGREPLPELPWSPETSARMDALLREYEAAKIAEVA